MSRKIILETIEEPKVFEEVPPVTLTDQTIEGRKQKVLMRMKEENLDTLIIYADKEHGSNFEYLTGFIPRFEEALLVLEQSGEATVILGNENLKMAQYSRIKVDLIHSPLFSLPNQPMDNDDTLENIFLSLKLNEKNTIGLIGWKMFTTKVQASELMIDMPYFIVDALKNSIGANASIVNAAHLLIGDNGARTTNNANELAHYEYGANLASKSLMRTLNSIELGMKETELGELLNSEGQYNSVVTIAGIGKRFENANFYPTNKKAALGEPMALTIGYKGGLSSRSGYIVENEDQLPEDQVDYLDKLVKPYFNAVVTWIENLKIGMEGGELYDQIEQVFPKEKFGWHLNPGHLGSDEEWMSSPIYEGSSDTIKSGMIFQIDIIPSVQGYPGVSAEECIAIADEKLQKDIQNEYPDLWDRITTRKKYLRNELNIKLCPETIPLSGTVAYLRPFYLARDKALKVAND